MTLFARLRSWLTGILHRSTVERDMDDELRFHIDSYAADLIRDGVARDEASRRARAEFGAIEANKDVCREARGLRLVDDARADVRYALRQLRRAPVFTLVATLSLGLGIGANTAIFSLMEQALWKSMPVASPQQLRLFSWVSGPRNFMNSTSGDWSGASWGEGSLHSTALSMAVYEALRQRASSFESVFAIKPIGRLTAIVEGQAELIQGTLVTGTFFETLQLVPILGRPITPGDDAIGNGEIVGVISDGYWARRFGRDPAIVGRQIEVNQQVVTIVGVNPPAFTGVESGRRPDIFLPLMTQPRIAPNRYGKSPSMLDNPDYFWLDAIGRLRPGVSDAQAESEADLILTQTIKATLPARPDRDWPHIRLLTGSRGLDNLKGQFAQPLLLLFSFVILVLLIACANVANLLLARAAARRRELSLRLALGAGRWRIARQLLTEGLALGLGGGLVGLLIGYATRNLIPSFLVRGNADFAGRFDLRVLLLAAAVTIATSILFSLAPIWHSMHVEINASLKDGGHAIGLAAPLRGRALIVFQVGLSVLLLIAAGLFARTLVNLQAVNLGFAAERLLLFSIDPPRARYSGSDRTALFERIRDRLALIPGVEEATLSGEPLVSGGRSRTSIDLDGDVPTTHVSAWVNDVGHRFTETMRIPIIAGRAFDPSDRQDSPPVALVTEAFVRQFLPGTATAVDRTFHNGNRVFRIVGVCTDVHFDKARNAPPPTFYRLVAQNPDAGSMVFELRSGIASGALMRSVRAEVATIDKDLPVYDVHTQQQQIDSTMANERLFATLTVAFGVLALVLACIGIYGVMANSVSRRTGEIGVRIALGANRADVLLMILRQASWLTLLGVTLGAGASVWLVRYVKGMLFGIEPADPLTIAGAIAVMLLVALFAGWLPARRAALVDPIVALRNE